MTGECSRPEALLVDLLDGRLPEAAVGSLILHLDGCNACRALVAAAAAQPAPTIAESARGPLPRLTPVGRYIVLDPVGVGSMGAVYAAYDPELDRKVALKLLRADALVLPAPAPAHVSPGELAGRLLREAQALARLSHPNVVAAYDVGAFGDGIFIAMELAEGGTLADWLAERRSVPQIVELLRQAGEGLAAAHAAGIVHRDFKPANVLLGRDGRVRVGDFGLSRSSVSAPGSPLPRAALMVAATTSTQTGTLIGTPAYMAPEQWAGAASDARTDLFGFSVTLHEALYGVRPFSGATPAELRAAIARNEVCPAPADSRVPPSLRRVVLRGLRADPAERYPSMRALLDDLVQAPRTRRALIAGALLLMLGALVVGGALARRAAVPVCGGADAAWGDVLSPAAQAALHDAFVRSGLKSAEFAFVSTAHGLDDYRRAWLAMHRDACEATRVRHAQSEALLDRRMVCLESRRKAAAALLSVLTSGGTDVVLNASGAVGTLPPIAGCAATPSLLTPDPPPSDPVARAQLARLDGEVSRARALCWVLDWKAGLAVLDRALPEITQLAHRPLQAKYQLARGNCEFAGPEFLRAIPARHEAARFALLSRDDAPAADAWIGLVRIVGQYANRQLEAEEWGRYAAAAISRLGGDDVRESKRLLNLSLSAHYNGGDPREALRLVEEARALLVKAAGKDDPGVIDLDEHRANVLVAEGRSAEALAIHRGTYDSRVRVYGPDSQALLYSLHNVGTDLILLGRADEALAVLGSVFSRWPDEGAHDAYGRYESAAALRLQGKFAAALEQDRAALAIQRQDGASDDSTTWPLTGEGLDLIGLSRPRDAAPLLQRALRVAGDKDESESARFALAQALASIPAERAAARVAALRARAEVNDRAELYGGRFRIARDAIDRWLSAHPARE